MWNEEEILEYLKKVLKEERYNHTLGVVKASEVLAKKHGCDVEKAKLAALLHDVAKYKTDDEILSMLKKEGVYIDELLQKYPQIMHGFCSAYIAKNKMGIYDKEVLDAITCHTTGKENMTTLEKVVCLADFIEEGRNYEGVEELRRLSMESLDKALIKAFDNTITYIINKGGIIYLDTIKTRNYLLINL